MSTVALGYQAGSLLPFLQSRAAQGLAGHWIRTYWCLFLVFPSCHLKPRTDSGPLGVHSVTRPLVDCGTVGVTRSAASARSFCGVKGPGGVGVIGWGQRGLGRKVHL